MRLCKVLQARISCDNGVCSLNGRFLGTGNITRPDPKKTNRRIISCWQNDWFGDSRKAGPPFLKKGNNMTKNPVKSANGELWFGFTETAFTNQLQWATSHSESLCFSGSRVPCMSNWFCLPVFFCAHALVSATKTRQEIFFN